MKWALIVGDIVDTVVEQNEKPTVRGEWVDITGLHVGPGFTYQGGVFTAPSTKATNNAPILLEIAKLEAGQLRGMREFMLSGDKTGLKALDDKIAVLRAKLEK